MKHKLLFFLFACAGIGLMDSFGVNAQTIAIGTYHSLSICSDKTVRAWGDNGYGQLGNGTTTDSKTPVQVTGLTGVTAIAAGRNHCFALKTDGTLWAWGGGQNGKLGNGSTVDKLTPVQVSSLSGITSISCGDAFSLGTGLK